MLTQSLVQINGRPAARPEARGGDQGDAVNRELLARALLKDRERFVEAVRAGEFYRLFWIKFKIIDGCNIKCVMCNHWRRDEYLRSFLTNERLMNFGRELAELGTRHVNWSGGEPTLRKDLPEIIGHYNSLGIRSSLISNGTRMTEEFARRLCDAGLARVLLSLESADPETHDRVVGSPGAWRKLIDGAGHLRRAGERAPHMTFTTVLTSLNAGPGLPEMVPLAASLGVKDVRFVPVAVAHLKPEEHALLPSPEQIERLRAEYVPRMLEDGRRLGVEIHFDGGDGDDHEGGDVRSDSAARISPDGDHAQGYYTAHTCYLPWYHCLVDWRGNVYACCHVDEEGLLGNIREESLIDVLRSAAARGFRQSLTREDVPLCCRDCVMQIAENQKIDRALGLGPHAAEAAGRGAGKELQA